MKKIAVLTGTRAEYGILKPLMKRIKADADLELCIVATGTHLSPEFGLTYTEIEKDGFDICESAEILMSSDSPVGICKSMGLGLISLGEIWQRQKPDLLIILGDRYEALAAASSAMVSRIPIAHLHGGELTMGAMDEAIRHSISKMSYLHFTATEDYRKRVIQLGECPDRVFSVGALGVENAKEVQLMQRDELEKSIGFKLDSPYALVTFHPVTLENNTIEQQMRDLLFSLFKQDLRIIFTKANSDTDGRIINSMIDKYTANNPNKACAFTSLGMVRYLSALKYCTMVIGNSSSGIIEAPSFEIPTINIGDRQKGRTAAESVIHCKCNKEDISLAIARGLTDEFKAICKSAKNPYEGQNTSQEIINIIKHYIIENKIDLKKSFYDIPFKED